METRIIKKDEHAIAKDLWAESFGDSRVFIDNYFSKKIEAQNIFGTFEGDRLVSMLAALPRVFMIHGNYCKSVFIAGCCTAFDSRNKGYMKRLLSYVSEVMRDRGCVFGFLHPFDHNFYRKLGWSTVSDMVEFVHGPVEGAEVTLIPDKYDLRRITDMYDGYASGFDFYFNRDTTDMNTRLSEHLNDGGHILCDYDIDWYCLYFVEDDLVDVIENTCRNDDAYSKMIYELSVYSKPVRYLKPGPYGSGEYTMMRVFDWDRAQHLLGQPVNTEAGISGALCEVVRKGHSLFYEQY